MSLKYTHVPAFAVVVVHHFQTPFSNMYISIPKTCRQKATKFYLKHHWGEGKAASGFGPDGIRTLVSMATDSSHRVIIGKKGVITFFQRFLIGSFSYLQVTMTYIRA